MCDLKANLNINMSLLCKLITLLIINQINHSQYYILMIISDQIMNILQQNVDEGSI